jgi:uncharacterized protein YndB with AHSA1/START domain
MGDVAAHGTCIVVEPPHRVVFSCGIPGNETLPPGSSTVEVVLTPTPPSADTHQSVGSPPDNHVSGRDA